MPITSRTAALALVAVCVAGAPHPAALAPARPGDAAPKAAGPQEVEVLAVMVDPRTEAPAVVLEGKRDRRRMAMSIGAAEATGIAVPLRGVTPPRPLTHDLFLTLFGRLNVTLTRVVITDLRDDIYYATVYLTSAAGEITLDARPSDAIALAIRARVPVLVEDRVFDKAAALAPGRGPRI